MSYMETLYNGLLAWKRKNVSYFTGLLWYSDCDAGDQFSKAIIDFDGVLLNHAWCQKNKKDFLEK